MKKVQCARHCTKEAVGGDYVRELLAAVTVVMAPPAMTMVTPPTRLADDRGVRRSGYGRPYAGNGSLAGACSEAQDDGAADE